MIISELRLILLCCLCLLAGCQPLEKPAAKTEGVESAEKKEHEHGHSHDDGDHLTWVQENAEHEGFRIALGQHGNHFHLGDTIEPAARITKDGKDVADATLYNSLVSDDGTAVIADEVLMVFEPTTETEEAHYAQGKLKIPSDARKFLIRFRIKLPGIDQETTMDIKGSSH